LAGARGSGREDNVKGESSTSPHVSITSVEVTLKY